MSSPGLGKPVDELDRHCHQYKQWYQYLNKLKSHKFWHNQYLNAICSQRCTKQFMGEECIGEFVEYNFEKKQKGVVCTDEANSCKRMVCECDLQFAKGIKTAMKSYDRSNHRFYGFDSEGSKYPNRSSAKRDGELQSLFSLPSPIPSPFADLCPQRRL